MKKMHICIRSFRPWGPFRAITWENQAERFIYQRNAIISNLNHYTYTEDSAATSSIGAKVYLRLIATAKERILYWALTEIGMFNPQYENTLVYLVCLSRSENPRVVAPTKEASPGNRWHRRSVYPQTRPTY